jgi:hypothetical protein
MWLGFAALMLGLHRARFWQAVDYSVFGAEWPFVDLIDGLGFAFAPAVAITSALLNRSAPLWRPLAYSIGPTSATTTTSKNCCAPRRGESKPFFGSSSDARALPRHIRLSLSA